MDKVNIYNNLSAFIDDDLISDSEQSMDTRIAKKTKTIKDPFLSLPCFEPWYNMIILPDGKAAQCSISGGKDGDNVSEKSLEDVWYGDAFNMIRERLLKKNLLNYCKRCCANVHVESEKIRQYLWK